MCVMDVRHAACYVKAHLHELRTATSVGQVFVEMIYHDLITYLEFSAIKRVIKTCVLILRDYNSSCSNMRSTTPNTLCGESARVKSIKESSLGHPSTSKDFMELVILTDDNWDEYSRCQCLISRIVANALGIDGFSLRLTGSTPSVWSGTWKYLPTQQTASPLPVSSGAC